MMKVQAGSIQKIWREWFVHVLVLILGVSLSFGVAWMVHQSQIQRAHENFEHFARKDLSIIQNQISAHKRMLNSLSNFYLSSQNIDRDEFIQFTAENFKDYKSFDAIGWIDFDAESRVYKYSHIQPNEHQSLEGLKISEDSQLFKMIEYALVNNQISHFIQTLDSLSFQDIHRDKSGRDEYHLIMLKPVFENLENGDQILHGIAYSVIDCHVLMKETFFNQDRSSFLDHVIERVEPGKNSVIIYGDADKIDTSLYRHVFTADPVSVQLIWYFSPTKKFTEQYRTNNTGIIFAVLCALTMAVLFMRQMAVNMRDLKTARVKAEEASRLKSDFLATMSHEIRTPMNGILGMADLIQDARPSPQIEGYVKTIINSGETLQQIIDDILDFSKIEAGRLEIDLMPVNMVDLVDDIANLYAVKARDKALEIVVRYVPGSEQFVFADPVRVRQTLSNLVNNAIKFTDKGHIKIEIEEERNSSLSDDHVMLCFSVSDTGIGLPKAAQAKIFDKFSQADSSTTRKYGGTGLGLSICQSLVELMGGQMGVVSEEDVGSKFWFRIPFKRNNSEIFLQPKPPVLQDIRVLVVDDLPVVCDLVLEQLRRSGMRCEKALSGAEALDKMKAAVELGDPYQIIIIDYLMPEMNGEMLACAINDYPELRDACLVMLTAAGSPVADDYFFEKGFSAYISKPVTTLQLVDSLSVIWSKYKDGVREGLIRVDQVSLGKHDRDKEDFFIRGIKILVAEDNLVNQVFIKEILSEMQADYTIVSNGQEALNSVREGHFSLIIMDCLMPVMDGFEATREICKLKDSGFISKEIPIIALTANAMKGDREACLAAGMDDYLSKPVRKNELKNKVCEWVLGEEKKDLSSEKIDESRQVYELQYDEDGLLDAQAVNQARQILKGKYDEMIDIYINNSREYLDEITQAVYEKNVEAIIRPAHTLKSTSKQMGAFKLSDMAKDVEHIAKALHKGEDCSGEDFVSISKRVENIKSMLSQTKRAFDKMAA